MLPAGAEQGGEGFSWAGTTTPASASSSLHNPDAPAKDNGAVGTDVSLVIMMLKSLHFDPHCFAIICFSQPYVKSVFTCFSRHMVMAAFYVI